jgi:hypothetical protein
MTKKFEEWQKNYKVNMDFENWYSESGVAEEFPFGKDEMQFAYENGSKNVFAELNEETEESNERLMDELMDKNNEIAYLKSIIKSLLDNSDEYAKQRAMDAVKVEE